LFVKTCLLVNPGLGPDPDRKVQNDAQEEFLMSEKSDAREASLRAKVLAGEGVLGARVLLCH